MNVPTTSLGPSATNMGSIGSLLPGQSSTRVTSSNKDFSTKVVMGRKVVEVQEELLGDSVGGEADKVGSRHQDVRLPRLSQMAL